MPAAHDVKNTKKVIISKNVLAIGIFYNKVLILAIVLYLLFLEYPL